MGAQADKMAEEPAAVNGSGHVSESRQLSVSLFLDNPDKVFFKVNTGKIILIDENGTESKPLSFRNTKPPRNPIGADAMEVHGIAHIPQNFGTTGAIQIIDMAKEGSGDRFYLQKIVVEDEAGGNEVTALADTWIHVDQEWRTIFTNKVYLPADTPKGLEKLRREELEILTTADGKERKASDRIYDYDVYNDLGSADLPRPTLGGPQLPYPRKERTGRALRSDGGEEPPAKGKSAYVPADEEFTADKQFYFTYAQIGGLRSVIGNVINDKLNALTGVDGQDSRAFDSIPAISNLYKLAENDGHLFKTGSGQVRAPSPLVFDGRSMVWDTDQEMGRQCLAGQNPCVLQALTGLPQGTSITAAHLAASVEGNNVQELFSAGRRLFLIDYTYLTKFVPGTNARVNPKQKGLKYYMYASRAIFYLSNQGLLRPIAIELIDIADTSKPDVQVPTVHTPNEDTNIWRLAKTYFANNDFTMHQMDSHWVRCHAVVEPYIIAFHRQLSALHPVYALLKPHFKYTMSVNRNARKTLFNAGGAVEDTYSPGEYMMRISAEYYDKFWQFDRQALPADLIFRGMAKEDPNGDIAWKGKKFSCILKDYPYAEDGMAIWNALHSWNTEYLKMVYKDDAALQQDTEVLAWWKEIQEKGHPDKTAGWPALKTVDDLADIITSITWIVSGHHAAVNFGQYDYGGYMPNRPPTIHGPMPSPKDPQAWAEFKKNPERTYLNIVSTRAETLQIMFIVKLLAMHDRNEEYLGFREEGWSSNPKVLEAFKKFQTAIDKVQSDIAARNADVDKHSRFPDYTLLYPTTTDELRHNLRGQGVPNSCSI